MDEISCDCQDSAAVPGRPRTAFLLKLQAADLKRQQSHPCAVGLHADERTRFQLHLHLPQGANDFLANYIGIEILGSDLHDARFRSARNCRDRAEIKIMCQHDVSVLTCVGHDFRIRRRDCPDARPVNGFNFRCREEQSLPRRKIHINQQLHARASSISRSSMRQAAYRKACRMSSRSKYG